VYRSQIDNTICHGLIGFVRMRGSFVTQNISDSRFHAHFKIHCGPRKTRTAIRSEVKVFVHPGHVVKVDCFSNSHSKDLVDEISSWALSNANEKWPRCFGVPPACIINPSLRIEHFCRLPVFLRKSQTVLIHSHTCL
jgi:hypothetical protein